MFEQPHPETRNDRHAGRPPDTVGGPDTPDAASSPSESPTARLAGGLPEGCDAPGCGTPAAAGRHALFVEIARGGMGVILRGRDPDLGRDLAVKVLRREHRDKPEVIQRFIEEARIAGQLQHPGVVPIYEIGRFADGLPYFTMKLVQGSTLAALLARRNTPQDELPRFLTIFEQVCQTLAYAHSRGVIHRDLKPSNVMVGAFGEVQVMDWGLAKVLRPDAQTAAAPPGQGVTTLIDAGRSGSTVDLSREGTVIGTPAFMPPEQAKGEVGEMDERADVFGLGAVLCTILTGQPPYTGYGPFDYFDKATSADLADALARLGRCGADAELVRLCEDCLAPRKEDRPRDAGAVARRLTAYQAGVRRRLLDAELGRAAALARAEEAKATAAAERRAKRRTLGLAAALTLLVLTAGGGAAWWFVQRSALTREVDGELTTAEEALRAEQWPQAQAAAGRAEARLAGGGPTALRDQLGRLRADLDAVAAVETARLEHARLKDGFFDVAAAERGLEAAFAGYGLDVDADDPEAMAARIRQSAVAPQLIAALDYWIEFTGQARADRLREVVRRADADEWRARFRESRAEKDREALEALAGKPEVADLPPATLVLLGNTLARQGARDRAIQVLQDAQRRHPGDLWINHDLARLLQTAKPPRWAEAIGYYRVALALRPHSPGIHVNLGIALLGQGNAAEAKALFAQAVDLQPDYAEAHNNLGVALRALKEHAEAETALRKALELKPDFALARSNLGEVLRLRGKREEAEAALRAALAARPGDANAHYQLGALLVEKGDWAAAEKSFRSATELKPDRADAYYSLGVALSHQRQFAEAEAAFRKAIERNKDLADAHYNLALALQDQGRWEEAEAPARRAVELHPDDADAHYKLGIILEGLGKYREAEAAFRKGVQLRPDDADLRGNLGAVLNAQKKWAEGEAACRQALELNPKLVQAHYNLGNALDAQGRPAEAVAAFRKAIELRPDFAEGHCNLGHALRNQGKFAEAAAELRKGHELGTKKPNWRYKSEDWVRQAEHLAELERKLPAVLEGKEKPANDADRLTQAWMCQQYKERYAGAARLYAELFTAQPKLADDLRQGHRYNAACAAALAAAGKGADATDLDDTERARLRKQALDWLRSDLALWARLAESEKPEERASVQKTLKHWQTDADLAGIRDQEALAKLPQSERDDWRKLWEEVSAVLKRASEPR
jgi:serine/threonine-protein kinase